MVGVKQVNCYATSLYANYLNNVITLQEVSGTILKHEGNSVYPVQLSSPLSVFILHSSLLSILLVVLPKTHLSVLPFDLF